MSDIVNILLVEDDEDDYMLTRDYLEQVESQRFSLIWVSSSKAALEAVQEQSFDLCLADYLLAGENALDLLALFSGKHIDVPVVVLSGQTDSTIDERVLRAGATDYLAKQELESPKFLRSLRYAMARKEVENARIERSKVELENKAKDRFLAHLGHELRTPLTSILGYTDLLRHDERAQAFSQELSIIHNNGEHLLSLLNDLLDMSKIIANKFELTPRKIPLSGFLTDVYSLMQIAAHDKGLALIFAAQTEIPESISADATRLRQVLINLLNNAVKYTKQGEVRLTVRVEQAAAQQGKLLRFCVADTGVGINEQDLKHIFKPFEQLEDRMLNERGGAGLGLSICQEIVARMGGELAVTSQLGKGSEFTFFIPLSEAELTHVEAFELTHNTLESTANPEYSKLTGRVLVVDDLPELRRLTGHLIMQSGAQVDFAENGEAAIHAISQAESQGEPFQLVLMDIHMPVMDGLKAVKRLRAGQQSLPIVALTAANHKGLADELMLQGFNGVLPKPLDRSGLTATLEAYLNRQSAESNPASGSGDSSIQTTVCVVEDDDDAAQLMVLLLSSLGVQAFAVASMAELKSHQSTGTATIFLIDQHLPDATGAEVAKYIRASSPESKLVFVSGAQPEPVVMQQLGVEQALLKPVSKDDLVHLLRSL